MTASAKSKYTPAMLAAITAAAEQGTLNLQRCTELASQPEFVAGEITPRMIVAKVRTMGLPYAKQVRVSKTGETVQDKAEITAEIAQALGVEGIESLAKAEKAALRKLRDAVQALASVEA